MATLSSCFLICGGAKLAERMAPRLRQHLKGSTTEDFDCAQSLSPGSTYLVTPNLVKNFEPGQTFNQLLSSSRQWF